MSESERTIRSEARVSRDDALDHLSLGVLVADALRLYGVAFLCLDADGKVVIENPARIHRMVSEGGDYYEIHPTTSPKHD